MAGHDTVKGSITTPMVVYALYLAGFVIGLTPIIGVVIAYVVKGDAPGWLVSHYHFQIRTFWISLFLAVVGMLLTLVVVGWLVLLFNVVWFIVRCVRGMVLLAERCPHPEPRTWLA